MPIHQVLQVTDIDKLADGVGYCGAAE